MINTQLDIRAKQYGSAAEIIEAARRRRERLFGSRQAVANENRAQIEAPKPVSRIPRWSVLETNFDQHVIDRHKYIAANAGNNVRNYVKKRALEMGLAYNDVVGKSKSAKLSGARDIIAYECHKLFDKTLNELGRIFNRDHTTVLMCIRRGEAKLDPTSDAFAIVQRRKEIAKVANDKRKTIRRKVAMSGKYKPNAAQIEVLRHIADGNNVAQVAKILGLSKGTIRTRFRRVSEATGITGHAAVTALAVRRGWVK